MSSSLSSRLDAINEIGRADRRGAELERFVADLFRAQHFDVVVNPGAARPRQTDVLASKATETYLIECKHRKTPATIDDLDSLRARLRRTDRATVVGVLVSTSGFTGTVLFDVEHQRDQPILLISGEELRRVTGRSDRLAPLLWSKRRALLADGRVLLDEPARYLVRGRRRTNFPAAATYFHFPDGHRDQVLECGGTFGQFVLVHHLPDIDWVEASGAGVTLDVRPEVFDEIGLLELIEKLAGLGWVSPDARWSIQQSTRNWHGLGCASFVRTLPEWKARAATPDAHHSEEICYADRCDGGFYLLTAKLSADPVRQTMMATLSFQLQGVPLDTGSLLQLCRSIGAHDGLYFRPRTEQSVSRERRDAVQVQNVQPAALMVTPQLLFDPLGEEWATGIVIANPFRDAPATQAPIDRPNGLAMLSDSELLICDLAEHHRLDGRQYGYDLRGVEHAWPTGGAVYRPIANWTRADEQDDEEKPPGWMRTR